MSKTMTREQIKHKLTAQEPMILVEALPQQYFDKEHLPGAINIPHDEIPQKALELLPDKEALIVVYCASSDCQNSKMATSSLQKMGYNNAHEYVEGKQHWLEDNGPIESTQSINLLNLSK